MPAGAVRLLDLGFFRVGGESYAEQHQTCGLATIRKSHVHLRGDEVTFDHVAKSGKQRVQTVVDPEVTVLVATLERRRSGGPELLAWRDEGGRWHDVKSHEINAFLQQMAGMDCSAKDSARGRPPCWARSRSPSRSRCAARRRPGAGP